VIVRLSVEAEQDLEAIGDFIAGGSPKRAISFTLELREKCLELADIPEGFPVVSRYAAQGVRRRIYGRYLIFYRMSDDEVTILHILHGAQDHTVILG